MTQIAIKCIAILAVNGAIGFGICALVQHDRNPERWETVGTLYLIDENESADIVFLGSSRSLALTQCPGTQFRVEQILGQQVLNLSTIGCGVVPAKVFLEHFYARGNHAETVVFFADAPFFLSKVTNEQMPNIEAQPLQLSFLWRCVSNRIEFERLVQYVRSKYRWSWFWPERVAPNCQRTLPIANVRQIAERTKKRNVILYHEGVQPDRLDRYVGKLEQLIQLAQQNGADVRIVILPTLLHTEPGLNTMKDWLAPMIARTDVRFADFSHEMNEPQYFKDLDHMNERGAAHLTRHFLAPFLGAAG